LPVTNISRSSKPMARMISISGKSFTRSLTAALATGLGRRSLSLQLQRTSARCGSPVSTMELRRSTRCSTISISSFRSGI
jgi:hypothetical protein